ncbi:MAG: tRNA epoxyqueuosine(34) reductase QueG [Flavobacteriaceae bacterium]
MQKDERLSRRSKWIKEAAMRHGFMACGIARAEFLNDHAPALENWLKQGMNGKMSYMERNFDKRLDPKKLVDGAKTVVSLLFNYYPPESLTFKQDHFKISKYAYGEDYHQLIRERLNHLLAELREEMGEVGGRAFVDSAPILEKAWAERSGLGWIAKNSNLINKRKGSFFFLAELIIDLECAYDHPMATDHCGTCTACIDACPTQAIVSAKVVDATKCISYFTIELKESIPTSFKGQFEDWAFGCDTCQDVCPWNRFSSSHNEPRLLPSTELLDLDREAMIELTEETFGRVFAKSAVKRTKFSGLRRNIDFLKG